MCYQTVTWAIEQTGLTYRESRVLIQLSYHKNHQTGQCNPSIETLSTGTGFCSRAIGTALGGLKRRELIRSKRTGKSNLYTFAFGPAPAKEPNRADHAVGEQALAALAAGLPRLVK